jgi:hypothetical protein
MKYAFTVTRNELYERLRSGAHHIFAHEALPTVRGWKHTFSMAPVASRKRVAAALFKAVTK